VGTGIGTILAILILDVLLIGVVRDMPVSLVSFALVLLVALSLLLAAILCYLVYGLLTLRYLIGRDSVVISWARRRETIPLVAIEAITPVTALSPGIKASRFRFPGYSIGRGRDARRRKLRFYSTGRRSDELLIDTAEASYVISPSRATGFLSAVRARRHVGPAQALEQTRREDGIAGLPIWRDWKALGLVVAAAVANVSLFAYIALRYPHLPEVVPLLSEAGQVSLIGAKEELFELPVIGLVVFVVNTALGLALHRWERPVTYSLAVIALLVQILVWSAAFSAVS
jgi:hypothetical protein